MTLLELYEKLCEGTIYFEGLCDAINNNIGTDMYIEFKGIMSNGPLMFSICGNMDWGGNWLYLSKPGVMTPERETFLLLFAAYKGEL